MTSCDHEHDEQSTPAPGASLQITDFFGIFFGIFFTVAAGVFINIGQGFGMVSSEFYAAARLKRERKNFDQITRPLR